MGRLGGTTIAVAGSGSGVTNQPPRFTVVLSSDTDSVTFAEPILSGGGGSVDTYDIVETDPGTVHDSLELTDADFPVTISGLEPNTLYTWQVIAHGPNGDTAVVVSAATTAVTVTPTGPQVAAVYTGEGDNENVVVDNSGGVTDGNLLVAIYSQDTGSAGAIGAPAGWTLYSDVTIGTASGVNHERVWWRIASSEASTWTFTADNVDASTCVTVLEIEDATHIHAGAKSAALGTNLAMVCPSVTTTVDDCLLIRVASYVPNPNPDTTTWSASAGSGTERADHGTDSGYKYQAVYTADLASAGASGTFTVTAADANDPQGTVTSANAITLAVADAGNNPTVTSVTAAVGNLTATTADLAVSAVAGNYDSLSIDAINDGRSSFLDTDGVFTVTYTRQAGDVTTYLDIIPSKAGAAAAVATRFGPYTIPATAGGTGDLPARDAFSGFEVVSNGELRDNELRTGNSWDTVSRRSVYEATDPPLARGLPKSSYAQLVNCGVTTTGAGIGGQGVFGNTVWAEDVEISNWGKGVDIGTGNPVNGHAWYVRQGYWYRVTIHESAYRTGGSYSLHQRAGTINGGLWVVCEDLVDESSAEALIGGTTITDASFVRMQKHSGRFTIGGLAGGTHDKAFFKDCEWDDIRVFGNWRVELRFENCAYTGSIDTSLLSGNVIGRTAANTISGLTRVASH